MVSLYENCKDAFISILSGLRAVRRDPEAFQKAGLVAFSAIQAINLHFGKNYLPNLVTLLEEVPTYDFFGILRLPYALSHPYGVERIDQDNTLNQLERLLCNHLEIDEDDIELKLEVHHFSQQKLLEVLVLLAEEEISFPHVRELEKFIFRHLENHCQHHSLFLHKKKLSFDQFKITLYPVSMLENGAFLFSSMADVLCVPDFLHNWKVIDLSPLTKTLGRYPAFSFATKYSLGDLVWSCLLLSFILQAILSVNQLRTEDLSKEERKEITWKLVATIAESLFCLSNLLCKNAKVINLLCLFAKTTGLVSFFMPSKSFKGYD